MKTKVISIKSLNDIYTFLAKAQATEGDIIIKRGCYCIDGKSVLGIFSIDMSQNVVIEYPETAKEFEDFINNFEVSR